MEGPTASGATKRGASCAFDTNSDAKRQRLAYDDTVSHAAGRTKVESTSANHAHPLGLLGSVAIESIAMAAGVVLGTARFVRRALRRSAAPLEVGNGQRLVYRPSRVLVVDQSCSPIRPERIGEEQRHMGNSQQLAKVSTTLPNNSGVRDSDVLAPTEHSSLSGRPGQTGEGFLQPHPGFQPAMNSSRGRVACHGGNAVYQDENDAEYWGHPALQAHNGQAHAMPMHAMKLYEAGDLSWNRDGMPPVQGHQLPHAAYSQELRGMGPTPGVYNRPLQPVCMPQACVRGPGSAPQGRLPPKSSPTAFW